MTPSLMCQLSLYLVILWLMHVDDAKFDAAHDRHDHDHNHGHHHHHHEHDPEHGTVLMCQLSMYLVILWLMHVDDAKFYQRLL